MKANSRLNKQACSLAFLKQTTCTLCPLSLAPFHGQQRRREQPTQRITVDAQPPVWEPEGEECTNLRSGPCCLYRRDCAHGDGRSRLSCDPTVSGYSKCLPYTAPAKSSHFLETGRGGMASHCQYFSGSCFETRSCWVAQAGLGSCSLPLSAFVNVEHAPPHLTLLPPVPHFFLPSFLFLFLKKSFILVFVF